MKKILVVDNDNFIMEFMNDTLSKEGYQVVTAENGLLALDILKDFVPDVIFVDLIMPHIDGKKLIKIIRGMQELKDSYVIVLSAITKEDEVSIAETGADAVVAKGPLDEMARDILSVINQLGLVSSPGLSGRVISIKEGLSRKVAEELLSVKRHFEIILEKMSEGIMEINAEGRILYANPTAISLINIPEEQLLGAEFLKLLTEYEGQRVSELLKTPDDKPKRIGSDTPVNMRGYQVTLDILPMEGDDATSIIIISDVTEQKRAENALRQTNQFLRNILNSSSSISIISTDLDQNILFWNKGAENIFGYKAEELVGRQRIGILYPGDEAERVKKDIRSLIIKEKKQINCEVREITKDGRRLMINLNLTPRFDNKGNVVGILGVGEDITEKKRAEEHLHREKEKFRILTEDSPFGISLIGKKGEYKYINPKFIETFGYTLEDVPNGQAWFNKVYPDPKYRKQIVTAWISDFKNPGSGETRPRTFDVICKDGSKKVIRFCPVGIETGEQLVFYEDITEKRHLEAQLQHAQKMQSIGTIASGVAHNFRNILAGISMDGQLIQMKYRDATGLYEITERINNSVQKGAQLVEELMQFSRKEPRKLKILNLSEVLQETYQLITKSFDRKIDIRIDIPESISIKGDHSALCQVFINLCTNARDAMPEGGRLYITAKKERERSSVIISDTGHGMDKEIQEKCFDPFFTTKKIGQGTGLGLSTTYGIVKDHGGNIHGYSEPGKGTTFKLYFPLALTEKQDDQDVVLKIEQGKGEKILVVDDETEMLKSMIEMLGILNYNAVSVTNGNDAITKYKSWQPDAMLLDRNMPEMDGPRCAQRILDYDPGSKIILISGYDEKGPNGIDEKTRTSIKGYITKPIDIAELSQVLVQVFE